ALSGTRIRSTMILAPYRRAALTASRIVASSVTPITVTTSAPAFAAISTSKAPVSIVLRSATIVVPGNDFLSWRTTSIPSDLIQGHLEDRLHGPRLPRALDKYVTTCRRAFGPRYGRSRGPNPEIGPLPFARL